MNSDSALECVHASSGLLPLRVEDLRCYESKRWRNRARNRNDNDEEKLAIWIPFLQSATNTSTFVPIMLALPETARKGPNSEIQGSSVSTTRTMAGSRSALFLDQEAISKAEELQFFRFLSNIQAGNDLSKLDFDYSVFEELLPSQNVAAESKFIYALYCITFFKTLELFEQKTNFQGQWSVSNIEQIGRWPRNTVCKMENSWVTSGLGLLWIKQPCEDSAENWIVSVKEATHQATIEFVDFLYGCWKYSTLR